MPFASSWMSLDIWQLVTSQDVDCTDDEYKIAEKIVQRIGPAYEWPRRAILTFAGAPGSLKHNSVAGQSMSRFAFAVWAVNNGCCGELLSEWVTKRKLINDAKDLSNFKHLVQNLVAGRITEVSGRPITVSILASNQSRRQRGVCGASVSAIAPILGLEIGATSAAREIMCKITAASLRLSSVCSIRRRKTITRTPVPNGALTGLIYLLRSLSTWVIVLLVRSIFTVVRLESKSMWKTGWFYLSYSWVNLPFEQARLHYHSN